MNREIMKRGVIVSAVLWAVAGFCFECVDSKRGDLSEHGKLIRRGDVLAADGFCGDSNCKFNLQVRVCGWNVRWNDMTKKELDAYIRRAENLMK